MKPSAQKARATLQSLIGEAPKSSIPKALRRSPLAGVAIARTRDPGRPIDL